MTLWTEEELQALIEKIIAEVDAEIIDEAMPIATPTAKPPTVKPAYGPKTPAQAKKKSKASANLRNVQDTNAIRLRKARQRVSDV